MIAHSSHAFDLITLPARFWKWRMRGAALVFARKVPKPEEYAGVFVTDLMSVADLKALWGGRCPPVLLYFHENQFSYPLGPEATPDYQFGFTHMSSALAADAVRFNSRTHQDAFFTALSEFLNMMPDCRPRWIVPKIRAKSDVLYPGFQLARDDELATDMDSCKDSPPIIVWNHRWEHDKNPRDFFEALKALQASGLKFRLALLGQRFQNTPPEFVEARDRFDTEIVCYGYRKSRSQYEEWLRRGAVVVSTAHQENFGMAVIEATRCGCYPLLPNRLSYPEIAPPRFHADVLYENPSELIEKMIAVVNNIDHTLEIRTKMARSMGKYCWRERIGDFDRALTELVETTQKGKK
jgi:glycosyltransferase involved in cell wall biosynthesis